MFDFKTFMDVKSKGTACLSQQSELVGTVREDLEQVKNVYTYCTSGSSVKMSVIRHHTSSSYTTCNLYIRVMENISASQPSPNLVILPKTVKPNFVTTILVLGQLVV